MRYLLLLFFISICSYAQVVTYKGTVSDDSGMPLPGANICVKNTTNCTTSDLDGKYSLKVAIGSELSVSYIGMSTRFIKITPELIKSGRERDDVVQPIVSSDYINSVKSSTDTVRASEPSGETRGFSNDSYIYERIVKITKNKDKVYSFLTRSQYSKLYLELYSEFTAGEPIRQVTFQKQYAQGRSLNGEATYQGPETNEIFSWGPALSTLEMSDNATPYYPGGNIVAQFAGNGSPVALYNKNNFFRHSSDQKTSLTARLVLPDGAKFKFNLGYRSSANTLPTAKNDEVYGTLSFTKYLKGHSLSSNLSFNHFENGLSNSNFIYNKAIFANAVTPIHFNNKAGSVLSGGQQRSYSLYENNPYYLLNNNKDENYSSLIGLTLSDEYRSNDVENTLRITSELSDIKTTGGNIPLAAQVADADYSVRKEKYSLFSLSDEFKYNVDYRTSFGTKLNVKHQERTFGRTYQNGYSSLADYPEASVNQYDIDRDQDRFEVALGINGSHQLEPYFGTDGNLDLFAAADAVYSSTLINNFYANANAGFNWKRFLFDKVDFYGSYNFKQYEPDLQNNNLSFNSLAYSLTNFKQLRNNRELFTPDHTTATRETNYRAGIRHTWPVEVDLELYFKKVNNLYAPIQQGNAFNWLPAVDYEQKGLEVTVDYFYPKANNKFKYATTLTFTTYKNKVTGISQNVNRIPTAGFADVNKNYMVGQPLGAMVGSAFKRDENHNVVIDDQGFPMVADVPAVIGDPNPDFVMGLFNSVTYKKLSLSCTFDWNQGGDLWNGTAQTLNYYGVSNETAAQRNVTGYIFKGVTQSGQPNTQPVSFYDTTQPVTQNRWTRYGVGGVAESAIEDATYFRLNNVTLTYTNDINYYNNKFSFTVSAFVNNVFILANSDTAFAANSLFNSAETSGLDYFNSPMLRMYGLSLGIKF